MAIQVLMPALSPTMTEGTIAKWLKQVGDAIESGDVLCEIETDKATMEFESFFDGVLLHIGVEQGGAAPVDSLLCILGEKGEDISALLESALEAAPVVEEKAAPPAKKEPEAAAAAVVEKVEEKPKPSPKQIFGTMLL